MPLGFLFFSHGPEPGPRQDISIVNLGAPHEVRKPVQLPVTDFEDGQFDAINFALLALCSIFVDQSKSWYRAVLTKQRHGLRHYIVTGCRHLLPNVGGNRRKTAWLAWARMK